MGVLVTLKLRRQRQEDLKCKACVGYTVGSHLKEEEEEGEHITFTYKYCQASISCAWHVHMCMCLECTHEQPRQCQLPLQYSGVIHLPLVSCILYNISAVSP